MLTPLQQEKLTHYFRLYDVDDDGRLTQIEGSMPRLTAIPPGCASFEGRKASSPAFPR